MPPSKPYVEPAHGSLTVIMAPLSGELVALERVPDAVFSEKMVGDGIAIDPLDDVLRAPCDGRVAHLHKAGHAITVINPDGVQILMHIGLDTVRLRGEGFLPVVKQGDHVLTGAPLIEFDLDFVATHAKSLLTPVVVANSNMIASFQYACGLVKAGADPVFTLFARLREAVVTTAGSGSSGAPSSFRTRQVGMCGRPRY